MDTAIADGFHQRLRELQVRKTLLHKNVTQLSWWRVALFLLLFVAIVSFANIRAFDLLIYSVLGFIPIFGIVVTMHNKQKYQLLHNGYLIVINESEMKRLNGELSSLDTAPSLVDDTHHYADDLDLFGDSSLFQLLVRSKLKETRLLMKNWMLYPASKKEILQRQQAVEELKKDRLWRQNLTAYGYDTAHEPHSQANDAVGSLIQWLDRNLTMIDHTFWRVIQIVMPLCSTIVLLGIGILSWQYQWLYIPICINFVCLFQLLKPLSLLTKECGEVSNLLKGYEKIIAVIESKTFESTFLLSLKGKLRANEYSASRSIRYLRRILHFLLNRANILYLPFNVLFLLDAIWLRMALKWKKENILHIAGWLEAVHRIDALSNLADYSHINPSFSIPVVADEPHQLVTIKMGHPMISATQRVYNDFQLSGKGQLALITGSNMSGKSTFQRTVGINLVLAQMGAVVCASHFQFSTVHIFTSMRTKDNLKENVSSFYAELKRLKLLLDTIAHHTPVFYLLDEILKGTNSDDRHKGAISLIYQLTNKNCRGLVSTHDIQLSELSKDEAKIHNFSFNSTIQNNEILFDYIISNQPCQSFNASKLMENMGIIR